MKQIPSNITTEIIRDYPGGFVLERVELDRLLEDMQRLLRKETDDQESEIRYWVGLKNGIIYETEDLDLVFSEENAQSLTIVLFIVFGQLTEKEQTPVRRIIVHFSRGKPSLGADHLETSGGQWFNLNYRGISYRVMDENRQSALEVINAIEERLKKFRRWYSGFKIIPINLRVLAINLTSSIGFGVVLYIFSVLVPKVGTTIRLTGYRGWSDFDAMLYHTANFIRVAAYGVFAVLIILVLTLGVYTAINWLIAPSVIAIGDEIKTYKRDQMIRQGIIWTIIIGGIVNLVVNLVTR